MRKLFVWMSLFAIIGLTASCGPKTDTERSYNAGINIIPMPAELQQQEGNFTLKNGATFYASTPEAKKVAEFFIKKLQVPTGYTFNLAEGEGKDGITLTLDATLSLNEEGYQMTVAPGQVKITAKAANGQFYGMQTLLQLLPAEVESPELVKDIAWTAPCVTIKDEPRFGYRGNLIDVCRHFMTIEDLKRNFDVLAMFKINTVHLHLTEDQGWRIEIKKYPKLTEIGSIRTDGNGTQYGGFYTQEELKDLVAYAAERFITIIPEIEIPGHELGAIAAYPELSCKGEPTTTRSIWGVEDVVMCPGKEDMFNFLKDVLAEVVPIFPGKYFHIGGDECPKVSWKNCPRCQAKIRQLGLRADKEHSAEEKLQSYVIQYFEKVLAEYGKKIIGWDEILQGGLSPNATVMSWRGEQGGIAADMQDHDVIMTPSSNGMYLDYFQGDSKIEPIGIGGYFTLDRTYNYNPTPDTLITLGKEKYILGVQGNCWAEYFYDINIREYRTYPRMVAVAEVGWTPNDKKDLNDFYRRMNNAYVRMDGHKINYHIPQPEQPNGSCNFVAFTDTATLTFKTTRPMKVVYTTDGSTPNINSKEYTEPLKFTKNTTLKICSVLPSGKTSPVRVITIEKQAYAPAQAVENAQPGLKMKVADGQYFSPKDLDALNEWKDVTVKKLEEIPHQVPVTTGMRDVPFYAAVAEGYFNVPADGVYFFSANYDQVWIDGKLLISNEGEVKRFSKHDSSVALAAGAHSIKVVFLGNIFGGWPSQYDNGTIQMREAKAEKWAPIQAEQLCYTK